jgi:putative endonuclease
MEFLTTSKKLGQQAENFACDYLSMRGLKLITRNYTCRLGEIDLIMRDKEVLVFIEVRYRRNPNFGHSVETVLANKQSKMIKTATYYLQCHPILAKKPSRFDVLGLSSLPKRSTSLRYPAQVEWIKNAFSR